MEQNLKLAFEGDVEAQWLVGYAYYHGEGVDENNDEAFRWFTKAAQNNHPKACDLLGYCYAKGYGVDVDLVSALYWYEKGASLGDLDAMVSAGCAYVDGEGTEADLSKAFAHWSKAAKLGSSAAHTFLGLMYQTGDYVEKDATKAYQMFEKAAEQDDAVAMCAAGQMSLSGEGTPFNLEKAISYLSRAAELEDVEAQYELGLLYCNGDYVERNIDEAIKWWTRAAESGQENLEFDIGNLYYEKGNYVESAEWMMKAAEYDKRAFLLALTWQVFLAHISIDILPAEALEHCDRAESLFARLIRDHEPDLTDIRKECEKKIVESIAIRGDAYWAMDDQKNAVIYYEKALSSGIEYIGKWKSQVRLARTIFDSELVAMKHKIKTSVQGSVWDKRYRNPNFRKSFSLFCDAISAVDENETPLNPEIIHAYATLGLMTQDGLGTKPNTNSAYSYYEKAAALGTDEDREFFGKHLKKYKKKLFGGYEYVE